MKRQPDPQPTPAEIWIKEIARPKWWQIFSQWFTWNLCCKCKSLYKHEPGWRTKLRFQWGRICENEWLPTRYGCQECFPTRQGFWDYLEEADRATPFIPPKGGSGTGPLKTVPPLPQRPQPATYKKGDLPKPEAPANVILYKGQGA